MQRPAQRAAFFFSTYLKAKEVIKINKLLSNYIHFTIKSAPHEGGAGPPQLQASAQKITLKFGKFYERKTRYQIIQDFDLI